MTDGAAMQVYAAVLAVLIVGAALAMMRTLVEAGRLSRFLFRRIEEDGHGAVGLRQFWVALLGGLPVVGASLLRRRARRYANHPDYRPE
jgi:hypothetical protein